MTRTLASLIRARVSARVRVKGKTEVTEVAMVSVRSKITRALRTPGSGGGSQVRIRGGGVLYESIQVIFCLRLTVGLALGLGG